MASKLDPLWIDMFCEIAEKKWTRKHNLQQAAEFHSGICADVEKILKRPPTMTDFDADLVALLIRKWISGKQFSGVTRGSQVRARVERLKWLALHIKQRFKREEATVDWESFPLTRKKYKAELLEVAKPLPMPAASEREIAAGMNPNLATVPLTEIMDHYRRDRLTGKSPNSGRLMDVAITNFAKFLCRTAVLGDLNERTVLDYADFVLSRGQLSRASIRTNQERLLALWRYAVQKHWLLELPAIKLVTVPERVPDAWSTDDLQKLVSAAQATEGYVKDTAVPWSLFWPTLIYFLFDTGERIGAAVRVCHDDIAHGWVKVRAEYRKGQTRDKRFKLRDCTLENIARIRTLQSDEIKCVFHFPYSSTYLWKLFDDVLTRAGLPTNRRCKYHKIRRTSASLFERAGGDATRLLDHRNRATTQKYLDPSITNEKQLVDLVAGIGEQQKRQSDGELITKLREILERATA